MNANGYTTNCPSVSLKSMGVSGVVVFLLAKIAREEKPDM
jgi:hypothetical protein